MGFSRNRLKGQRRVMCDTCGVTYFRSQLLRGRDGFLRCSGAGTMNDARGLTALELDEFHAQAAEAMGASSADYIDDGGRFDDTEAELAGGGDEIGV